MAKKNRKSGKEMMALGERAGSDIPVSDRTIAIGGREYIAENADKWHRAVYGTVSQNSELKGGAGETASPEAKLAAYDRLAGHISHDGRKVKNGSFWDFKAGKPIQEPDPILQFRMDGELVEIPVGEGVPLEVQVAEIAASRKADRATSKAKAKVGASRSGGKKGAKASAPLEDGETLENGDESEE